MDTPKENGVFKATELRFADNMIPALKFTKGLTGKREMLVRK